VGEKADLREKGRRFSPLGGLRKHVTQKNIHIVFNPSPHSLFNLRMYSLAGSGYYITPTREARRAV
jgi:hypothetical protein